MRHCRNCSEPGDAKAGVPLRNGFCPQCAGAVRLALADVARAIKPKRAQMLSLGDEAGDAFAYGLGYALREIRRATPKP